MKNLLATLFTLAGLVAFGQLDPTVETQLQNLLDTKRPAYNLPGVEATVISNDGCTWTGSSGIATTNVPIDTSKQWHWGSAGKAMTTALMLQLVDSNIVDLQDVVGMYLDTDTILYLDSATTIESLLNHTTNLANSWDNPSALRTAVTGNPSKVWNIREVVDSLYRRPQLASNNGDHRYQPYDNLLFAGFILEEVTGKSLATLYQNRLFTPLGMTNSNTGEQGLNMSNLNGLYQGSTNLGTSQQNAYMSTRGGGGTYLGGSIDIARFMRAFHQNQLVDSTLMHAARTPTQGAPAVVPNQCLGTINQTYGYGTNILDVVDGNDTIRLYGHGGNGLGNCLVFHSIEEDITIAITTNDQGQSGQFGNVLLFMDVCCYLWDNLSTIACNVVDVPEEEIRFTLHPNPGSEVLHIESTTPVTKVELRDTMGRLVLQSTATELNTTSLADGLYSVQIFSASNSVVKKWLKQGR